MCTAIGYKCAYKFCTETPFCVNISKQSVCETKRSVRIIIMYLCVVLSFLPVSVYSPEHCIKLVLYILLGLDFVSHF
jgi:hypothetical protein